MRQAYYSSRVTEFLCSPVSQILGILTQSHRHELTIQQKNAWLDQLALLQRELRPMKGAWLALEFSIPRMGRRVDAILIEGATVFVIEFKVGSTNFDASAIDQVTDYALDLKNFHAGSHEKCIVPVVIATKAIGTRKDVRWSSDWVAAPLLSNGSDLGAMLSEVLRSAPANHPIHPDTWLASGYRPTPTIVEAAQALYRGHRVEEISRSDAGAKNLGETTACLEEIIDAAKAAKRKAICFVTGVPGAGKTLAGLNLVTHRARIREEEHAVFLSGNGPLVDVLREALARDELAQAKDLGLPLKKGDATRKVKAFIQNIHHFRDASLLSADAPVEHVTVFDEAQRAWNAQQTAKFMAQKRGISDFAMSEPEFLISIMDRHREWCTVVCLVGGGQEINAGEAGLKEWFDALRRRFPGWLIYTSPQLKHRDYHRGEDLTAMLEGLEFHMKPALHLAVSVRSFRAEMLSEFVSALIAGDIKLAREHYAKIKSAYPIALTRDLQSAKAWLRNRARGSERFGLVASSGAHRLKPDGLNVSQQLDAPSWFLNGKQDVRSSYYLEDPATEFDVQGLELDWVGVCWEGDLRRAGGRWAHQRFRGTSWQNVNSETDQMYLENAYRVLLTRARQGMVIYLPEGGDPADPTRPAHHYDGTFQYLLDCGLTACEP
ncbi:DUF2075 domain-containing protein [Bradyrhizobium sp. CCBAU 45384]|uniref:DUF2075 domain-containing protein n=1 Tax=Bradyrhizobium sp. CCBAU 45384 TaxID=858428 RepID=UPI002306D380|nr:DUF2075 domain-containing protein [Bradyrhizobium sp. CCBAU 45384]MDA9407939.1 hypothetical protein [Bradyrhizobium sp. CCBAU 45384]